MATDVKPPQWVFTLALVFAIILPLSVCLGGYLGFTNAHQSALIWDHIGPLSISLIISGMLPCSLISTVLCLIICFKRPEFCARVLGMCLFLNLSFFYFSMLTAESFIF